MVPAVEYDEDDYSYSRHHDVKHHDSASSSSEEEDSDKDDEESSDEESDSDSDSEQNHQHQEERPSHYFKRKSFAPPHAYDLTKAAGKADQEDDDEEEEEEEQKATQAMTFSSPAELKQRLDKYYAHVDPVGVEYGEVNVEHLVNWAMTQPPDVALRMIEEELRTRYGLTLERFEQGERLSDLPSRRGTGMDSIAGRGSTAESEFDEDDEDVVRDQLSQFFLEYAPDSISTAVETYLSVFRTKGRIAMNMALYDEFGANLSAIAGTNQRTKKNSSFNHEKFGVKVASDDVLHEMARFKRLSSLRPTQRNESGRSTRTGSAVSDSLARRWKRMSNRRDVESSITSERVDVSECPGYAVDVSAAEFGACKWCGKPRTMHKD